MLLAPIEPWDYRQRVVTAFALIPHYSPTLQTYHDWIPSGFVLGLLVGYARLRGVLCLRGVCVCMCVVGCVGDLSLYFLSVFMPPPLNFSPFCGPGYWVTLLLRDLGGWHTANLNPPALYPGALSEVPSLSLSLYLSLSPSLACACLCPLLSISQLFKALGCGRTDFQEILPIGYG